MTEIQRAKREVSMRFWQKAIMNRKASGLTVAAFCRQHELNVHAYYYWQRQIRKELLQKQAAPADQNKNNPAPNQREQASTTTPSAGRPADIVPFSAALDMAKAEHSPLPSTAVPAITIRYGMLKVDIWDGTLPELFRMVMSYIREEAGSC